MGQGTYPCPTFFAKIMKNGSMQKARRKYLRIFYEPFCQTEDYILTDFTTLFDRVLHRRDMFHLQDSQVYQNYSDNDGIRYLLL